MRISGLADPALVPFLRARLGTRLMVGSANAEGQVHVEVSGPAIDLLVGELAGYGSRLLVVDPPAARSRLVELAADLRRLYGDPGGDPADITPGSAPAGTAGA